MKQSIIENDSFVYLLLAAKQDAPMRKRILNVLRKDDATRYSELEKWALESESKQAPSSFVDALRYLKIPEIAFKAIEVLLTDEQECFYLKN
jgi:hypothetical protein